MRYRFNIISDEMDDFLREIVIDSEATFLELNKAILDSCQYPDDQMTSFYLCDHDWEKQTEVTREDMGVGSADEDVYVMDGVRLSELIEEEGQRLMFIFDPFSERALYMEVKEFMLQKDGERICCTRSRGEAPVQLAALDAELPTANLSDDLSDESFYGSDGFDSDEFDPEGFEISDGDPYRD